MTDPLAALDFHPECDATSCDQQASWFVRIPRHATMLLCDGHATAARRFDKRHCDHCGQTIRVRTEQI